MDNVPDNDETRPAWVEDAEDSGAGSLILVKRTNGTTAGFRVPRTSLVEDAERESREEVQAATR